MNNQNLNFSNESMGDKNVALKKDQPMTSESRLTVGDGFNFGFGFGLAIILLSVIISILSVLGVMASLTSFSRSIFTGQSQVLLK